MAFSVTGCSTSPRAPAPFWACLSPGFSLLFWLLVFFATSNSLLLSARTHILPLQIVTKERRQHRNSGLYLLCLKLLHSKAFFFFLIFERKKWRIKNEKQNKTALTPVLLVCSQGIICALIPIIIFSSVRRHVDRGWQWVCGLRLPCDSSLPRREQSQAL